MRHSQINAVINDKLQGTVDTYLRCGGIVNNQKKGVLLSLPVKKLKSANIWQSYGKKVLCRAPAFFDLEQCMQWPGAQGARDNLTTTFFLVTLPNIHQF